MKISAMWAKAADWLAFDQREINRLRTLVGVVLANERTDRIKSGIEYDPKWVAQSVVYTRENVILMSELLRLIERNTHTTKIAMLATAAGVAIVAATILARL